MNSDIKVREIEIKTRIYDNVDYIIIYRCDGCENMLKLKYVNTIKELMEFTEEEKKKVK